MGPLREPGTPPGRFDTISLRRMAGHGRGDGLSNEQLFRDTGTTAVTAQLARRRLRWLGHAARMDAGKVTHQLMCGQEVRGGVRTRGAPRLTWTRVASKDLDERGLNDGAWFPVAQDRVAWKAMLG